MNYYIAMAEKQEIFTLMGGKVNISRGTYNPTSDAVWLAAFAPNNVKTVLDVGIGTGAVSLCMLAHNPKLEITGLDKNPAMLQECQNNAQLNKRTITLVESDISKWKTDKTFDLVVTNPPYFKGTPAKHDAHHNVNLQLWVKKCIARIKPRGYFCIITDALAVGEIISEINNHCGDIIILPLFGSKNTAERVLIKARLASKGGSVIYSGLSMNYEPVLRDGLTIDSVLSRLS